MTLELTLQGKKVSYADVDLSGAQTFAERKRRVQEYSDGIHQAFWKQLLMTPDWEIVLICQSKMNNP